MGTAATRSFDLSRLPTSTVPGLALEASAPTVPELEQAATRRRVVLPASVVVTLLGALLTVWLAPAFTRQWDDRQRARELKAVLALEIAGSAARTIHKAVPLANGQGDPVAVRERWLEEGLKIKVRMEAYFPTPIVSRWEHVVEYVGKLPFAYDAVADARSASTHLYGRGAAAAAYRRQRIAEDLSFWLGLSARERAQAAGELTSTFSELRARGINDVRSRALAEVELAIREVLASHPEGFSTSRGDLLRDLLP